MNIDSSIGRVRDYVLKSGRTKVAIAADAGISDTTLRDVHRPDWNPRAATLRAVERIIPPGFVPPAAREEAA